jgi:hypothetical protein
MEAIQTRDSAPQNATLCADRPDPLLHKGRLLMTAIN